VFTAFSVFGSPKRADPRASARELARARRAALRWCAGVALIFSALVPARASAQSCHMPALRDTRDGSYRVELMGVAATYHTSDYVGEYQGALARAAYQHPWFFVDAALPAYRLVRNGQKLSGVGDVSLDGGVNLWRSEGGALTGGIELAATLPTGSERHGLGMGHVMLMPGLFTRLQQENLTVTVQLAYARSVIDPASMHMHGMQMTGPLVNPMNMQELENALALSYALHPKFWLLARTLGAVPMASPGGQARQVVALGVQALAGPVDVSFEFQAPIVGTPFDQRTVLRVGGQW
jgi:hypothetical protein